MTTPTTRPNLLVISAAIAVILLSGVGIAKMMNWLPTSTSVNVTDTSDANAATDDSSTTDENAKATESASASAQKETCSSCGVVTEITPITQAAAPSGLGAVAGAVVGGVLGHQVGGGSGQKVATAAGVVGGAYAGNAIESKSRTTTSYRVRVRFEDGRRDSFSYAQAPNLSVGTAVRVRNGELIAR
jgi:outer membrane lipoprotein SlyB